MPDTLLQIEGLSAGYGEAVVITDISLQLAQGHTLALLGRNGTGKTTLMNTLAGATQQHSGSIQLNGVALHRLPSHQRAAAARHASRTERHDAEFRVTSVAPACVWLPHQVCFSIGTTAPCRSFSGADLRNF